MIGKRVQRKLFGGVEVNYSGGSQTPYRGG